MEAQQGHITQVSVPWDYEHKLKLDKTMTEYTKGNTDS